MTTFVTVYENRHHTEVFSMGKAKGCCIEMQQPFLITDCSTCRIRRDEESWRVRCILHACS